MITSLPAFELRAENKGLVEAFKAKNEDPSGAFVMTSYAAVQVIADAIKSAGTTDTDTLQKTLRATSFQTPIGGIEFDAKGDLKAFDFVIYEWHADGSKTAIN